MNAALGSEFAGGSGAPLSDVTQSGCGPSALVANHPTGNVGGVTPSKFSPAERGLEHLGQVSTLSNCAVVGPAATPVAIRNNKQTRFHNRVGVNERGRFSIMGFDEVLE